MTDVDIEAMACEVFNDTPRVRTRSSPCLWWEGDAGASGGMAACAGLIASARLIGRGWFVGSGSLMGCFIGRGCLIDCYRTPAVEEMAGDRVFLWRKDTWHPVVASEQDTCSAIRCLVGEHLQRGTAWYMGEDARRQDMNRYPSPYARHPKPLGLESKVMS